MNDTVYLTPDGKAKLEAELHELKTVGRLALAKRLKSAISMGDLSENADYHKAKEDQGFMEGRIQEIESILYHSEIIENKSHYNEVMLGARVTIQEPGFSPETYHIVGSNEADPQKGRISHESPIGQALLGHRVGDLVIADLPGGGTIEFEIIEIV